MLEYAIEKAREMDRETHYQRVYAVIVDKRGKIIAESSNSYTKTHPIQAEYAKKAGSEHKIFLHAEIGALIKAKGNVKGTRIYIARVGVSGNPLLACPCEVCELALRAFGFDLIEYTV